MTQPMTPRTVAGRMLLNTVKNLELNPNTTDGRCVYAVVPGTFTVADLRDAILAIEAEAASPEALDEGYEPILKALTYPCREPIHQRAAEALAALSSTPKEPTDG